MEFLFIGLNNFLKCTAALSAEPHFARSLGFIFDEQLTFTDQISALYKSATIAHS